MEAFTVGALSVNILMKCVFELNESSRYLFDILPLVLYPAAFLECFAPDLHPAVQPTRHLNTKSGSLIGLAVWRHLMPVNGPFGQGLATKKWYAFQV